MARVVLTDEERRRRRAEVQRRNYAKNAEKRKAARRARSAAMSPEERAKHNARQRQYYAANRQRMADYARAYRDANPGADAANQMRLRHGRDVFDWVTRAWDKQRARCYLCESPLDRRKMHIDHDHGCCPPRQSCTVCRRGLACSACNCILGYANDDLSRLVMIARNGEAVFAETRQRIAAKPRQETLI